VRTPGAIRGKACEATVGFHSSGVKSCHELQNAGLREQRACNQMLLLYEEKEAGNWRLGLE
jgi:hypothetical protein